MEVLTVVLYVVSLLLSYLLTRFCSFGLIIKYVTIFNLTHLEKPSLNGNFSYHLMLIFNLKGIREHLKDSSNLLTIHNGFLHFYLKFDHVLIKPDDSLFKTTVIFHLGTSYKKFAFPMK